VIKGRELLTKPGSTKEVYHLVIDLKGIPFKVGDSLGIYANNDPVLVERLIKALRASPDTTVYHPRFPEPMTLHHFLTKKAQISRLTNSFAKKDPKYLATHDIIDFLLEYPPENLQETVALFSPLLPRFYSIASSLLTHPNEAHLTVSVSTYTQQNELRFGVASHFLCHLAQIDTTPILCYIQSAPHFTLPSDDARPLIMVGPGTGIAPFRGFLQERIAKRAQGKHWLFFGERHRATDFFYEPFWNELVSQDKLILDLAFSRDQEHKIYVQHKLYEKGPQIWEWLSQEALFYLCGEADPMAKEVEATILKIVQECGKKNELEARSFLKTLRKERRYLADVY
jgi:sulfite reductase (NADPH) flavoprotein alpha-component